MTPDLHEWFVYKHTATYIHACNLSLKQYCMHCYVILDNHIPSKHRNESIMYGAEYECTNGLVANSFDTHVPCAVCYVPTRNALYTSI